MAIHSLKKTATNGKRLRVVRDVSYAEVHRGCDKLTWIPLSICIHSLGYAVNTGNTHIAGGSVRTTRPRWSGAHSRRRPSRTQSRLTNVLPLQHHRLHDFNMLWHRISNLIVIIKLHTYLYIKQIILIEI